MTGPPHVTENGKISTARGGHPLPEATSTTVYQLSLASLLPVSDGDRALRKFNTVVTSHCHYASSKQHHGVSASLSPAAPGNPHGVKLYTSPITTAPVVVSKVNGASSHKISTFQFPVLHPHRGQRPYGSVSSGSGVGYPGSASVCHPIASPQASVHSSSSVSSPGAGSVPQQFVVRGRGLAHTPIDDHTNPIDSIKDFDILTRTFDQNLQKALESQCETLCSSSGRSSPTITETQSPLFVSQGGWTTGNTTERSSLDSSYSLDDFDKQASNTVSQYFDEIESLLFEGPRELVAQQTDVVGECREWSSQFPHLRILGKQICPPKDQGFHLALPAAAATPSRLKQPVSILLDVTDSTISVSSELHGLSLMGQSVTASKVPVTSLAGHEADSSAYTFLLEEVIEEDGVYEDVIAVDYKNTCEDNIECKRQITPRRRRVGYPPITPNACVKDSVISGAFDHIWHEIMSWIRRLLRKYTSEITDSKHDVISFTSINPSQSTSISRELSLIMQSSRQPSFQRSNTHMGSSTDRSIDGILQISSMQLQNRHQLMDATESHVLSSVRPNSSLQSHSQQLRPLSHLRSSMRGATRGGRLAPLSKTASHVEEEKTSRHAMDALKVKRLTPVSGEPLPSPSSSFQRNGVLPPLDQHRKLQQGYRATSAIDNKDMHLLSLRDRGHFTTTEQTRPSTTHAMRSETPFGSSHSRRSSTPLGNPISSRHNLISSKSLDIRGNSLQPGSEAGHIHPDIQEDRQESPAEENIYRSPWNTSQPGVPNVYKRNRLSLR